MSLACHRTRPSDRDTGFHAITRRIQHLATTGRIEPSQPTRYRRMRVNYQKGSTGSALLEYSSMYVSLVILQPIFAHCALYSCILPLPTVPSLINRSGQGPTVLPTPIRRVPVRQSYPHGCTYLQSVSLLFIWEVLYTSRVKYTIY